MFFNLKLENGILFISMYNSAVIDLGKIKRNAIAIKRKLPKGVRFCAVVKADAYGHGAERVSSALYNIVDCFAVALPEEGVKLRLSGVDKDILVLSPCFESDLEVAVFYNLTLTVQRLKDLKIIVKEAQRQKSKVKVHFKYNTGMNRLGFDDLFSLNKALSYARRSKCIIIDGLYSHYANPQDKSSVKNATDKFLLANKLVKGYNENAVCHISASGGFLQEKFFDMVRIGILLYGYKPFKTDKIKVSPAMKVFSPVLLRRKVERFDGVLYGDYKTLTPKTLTLIRFGYADGLPRRKVKGQANNRCMDITALDKKVNGKYYPIMTDAEILAKQYGTITYEILTKITLRAIKIYKNE